MKNNPVKIIAGPCSINYENLDEIYKIAEIKINGKFAIWGTRVVGLKSRTNLNKSGKGMGIDFFDYFKLKKRFLKTKKLNIKKVKFPSIELAKKIVKETKLLVATEIMDPWLQLPIYEQNIPPEKLMIWNPAVNQLGWPIKVMADFVKKNKWYLGIKNPKWLGDKLKKVNNLKNKNQTSMEKTWEGLVSYADLDPERIFLIHRGVDIPEKRNYRNAPVHFLAQKVKQKTGCLLFFDPSHSHGPIMREKILPATIKAMKMKINDKNYLYDGILIEAGNSETDTEQHISLKELEILVKEISKFREIQFRE